METTQPTTFGDLLKRHRTAAGLTQEALAERACLSRKAVSALECGERLAPRRDTVRLLADALGLTAPDRTGLMAAARPCAASPASPMDPAPPRDPPCNLPAPPTPLLGREREVARALELLCRDDVRLLTLSGPAGVGKTRLSLGVAAGLRADYADGVFLVSLAPLSDPALVASAIAQALGLREQGSQSLHDTLMASLHDKRLLLLLDNFEHVAAAAPLLAALLAACPRLRLLVTSRAPVHVRGERVLSVPPLAVPDLTAMPSLDTLAALPAVALFVQRAEAAVSDFALTAKNATAVAAICVRLDGLPLAIELAAPLVTLLPPPALLARLERRLQLLMGGARDLPERQQTLRAALAWSYDLLHAGEQALFRRLSVFAGGATLEAVEAVCHTAGDVEGDALGWLAALVDKSLLRREEGPGGEARVGMLETIREYGREQLTANRELKATGRAHAAYYLDLAEWAEPELRGSEQVVWLERLERDHNNLSAALRWALQSGERAEASEHARERGTLAEHSAMGMRLAGALWQFWWVRGHLSEGRGWLEELLRLDVHGCHPSLVSTRAKMLHGAGMLAFNQAEYRRAVALHEESLALYQGLEDRQGIAIALYSLGNVAIKQGEYARAAALYEESLALGRQLRDARGIARALTSLGNVAFEQGDNERAAALFEEGLVLCRKLRANKLIAAVLTNLGNVRRKQGDYGRASLLHEEGLALHRDLGDKYGTALSLVNLGDAALDQGDAERAIDLYEESLVLSRTIGDKQNIAYCLEGMARVANVQGRADRAVLLYGAAATLRVAIGAPLPPTDRAAYEPNVAILPTTMGETHFAAAWAAGAALSLEQAIDLALEEGPPT